MKNLYIYFFLFIVPAFSQELTLEHAINLTLKNEKTIKNSEVSLENAQLDLSIALKTALPNIVLNGTFENSEYTRTIANNSNTKTTYQQALTIYQPIFQGGAILGGIEGAKAFKNIANLNYLSTLRDTRLNTINIYCNILILQNNLHIYTSSKNQLKETYNSQQEQLKMNLVTLADLLKTDSSILELESQIIDVQNQITIQKLNLKILTGISEQENINLKKFIIPSNFSETIDFSSNLSHALTGSLLAKIAENNLELSEAEALIARANLLPQINAFAQLGGVQKKKYSETMSDSWSAGLTFTWNVFNFGKDLDNYEVAKNNKKIQKTNSKITQDNIKINVTDAYLQIVKFEKLIDSNLKNYQATKENLNIDTARYERGLISTIDYLLSFSQFIQASVSYNVVVLQYYVAFETYRSLLI